MKKVLLSLVLLTGCQLQAASNNTYSETGIADHIRMLIGVKRFHHRHYEPPLNVTPDEIKESLRGYNHSENNFERFFDRCVQEDQNILSQRFYTNGAIDKARLNEIGIDRLSKGKSLRSILLDLLVEKFNEKENYLGVISTLKKHRDSQFYNDFIERLYRQTWFNYPDLAKNICLTVFSKDGTMLATVSSDKTDKTAKIWDVKAGTLIHTLQGHTELVASGEFSPDGTMLATVSSDKTAKIWDVKTGKCKATLTGHANRVTSVAFSKDGTKLATASLDSTAKVWDIKKQICLQTLKNDGKNRFASALFSQDNELIVAHSSYRKAKIWNTQTGELQTIEKIASVVLSPDGLLMATTGYGYVDNKFVRLWNIKTGTLIHTLQGHIDPVASVAFSPNSQLIATGSEDTTAKIWDTQTGQLLMSVQENDTPVVSVVFSSSGELMVINKDIDSGNSNIVHVFNPLTGEYLARLPMKTKNEYVVSADGQSILGIEFNNAQMWGNIFAKKGLTLQDALGMPIEGFFDTYISQKAVVSKIPAAESKPE